MPYGTESFGLNPHLLHAAFSHYITLFVTLLLIWNLYMTIIIRVKNELIPLINTLQEYYYA